MCSTAGTAGDDRAPCEQTTQITSNKTGKVRMEEGSVITDLLLNLQLVCDTTSDLKWTPCRVKFKHTMRNGNFKFRHKD